VLATFNLSIRGPNNNYGKGKRPTYRHRHDDTASTFRMEFEQFEQKNTRESGFPIRTQAKFVTQVNAAAQANAPSSTGRTEGVKAPAVASALRVIAKQVNSESDRKYAVGGDIRRKWLELGGETGRIGCPVEDEQDTPKSPQDTEGRYAKFHGTDHPYYIFWHKNGAHAGKSFVVFGKIGVVYDRMGQSKSWLGFPISDKHDMQAGAPGWRQSDFEGGASRGAKRRRIMPPCIKLISGATFGVTVWCTFHSRAAQRS
jgi:hypothetical protein